MLYLIYVLIDPRNGVLFYVGITKRPKQRLLEHISNSNQEITHMKFNYIEELRLQKQEPIMCIVDEIETKQSLYAFMLERAWIWIINFNFKTLINTNISPHIENEYEAMWYMQQAKENNAKANSNQNRKILLSY